ncbi:phosphopentomutase [Dongia rigui]|uniref:Phosphopentomutase n=1 Tax=Dongia rigui TaxID=940149 RepID=A0ABU5DTT1_9PROT|nr:phosphopentomutase [Dongia rigui]MDY0870613.1 phosphopentomutase [Dongia rigui]
MSERRAFILVMDSFGIGAAPDAGRFGDLGADTLGHIAAFCMAGKADRPGLRSGPLRLPNLEQVGLGLAAELATGQLPAGFTKLPATGAFGAAAELSAGKDTPSGHWEMAGCPVPVDWGYFPKTDPCFPPEIMAELVRLCALPGIIGNCHASGTEVLDRLGEEHIRSSKPICYTSADSVFQIAAHEQHFGLDRLLDVCQVAKRLLEPLRIARVIARPFVGERKGAFKRTSHRRDFTTPPPEETLLDRLQASGREVISVGKIADIFGGRGPTRKVKGEDNTALVDVTLELMANAPDGSLTFANFVDFDTLFGHRRDVAGYAAALEAFDARIPHFHAAMRPGDLALITADHGCDPTSGGTDHTREFVPVLFFGPSAPIGSLGRRTSFADMGQTIAKHLGLAPLAHGTACF